MTIVEYFGFASDPLTEIQSLGWIDMSECVSVYRGEDLPAPTVRKGIKSMVPFPSEEEIFRFDLMIKVEKKVGGIHSH